MFKVIIGKYDPVAIYFTVLGSGLYTLFATLAAQFQKNKRKKEKESKLEKKK